MRLGWPFGRALGEALLLLLLILGLGEAITRTAYVQKRLSIPSIGLDHCFFEADLYWLDQAVARGESIEQFRWLYQRRARRQRAVQHPAFS
ncbi:MAG: hypothetical protein AB1894_20640 [Chloroflexota bacterium]